MDYYSRIQKAVDFIEANLENAFTLTDVSKRAFSSLSYLHRVFYFMTGYTVKEYIRKRRLSQAAVSLHCSKKSIIDIALTTFYDSPESFSRAFKKHYGISPRDFRQQNQEIELFNKLDVINTFARQPTPERDFDLTLKYVIYKSVEISGFQTRTTLEGGQQAIDICNFADKVMGSNQLVELFHLEATPVFGVYTNMTDENEFDYTIGCLTHQLKQANKKLVHHILPTSRYDRFTLTRADRIKEAWHYIYGSWFPKNEAVRTKGFDFETYGKDSVEIYIPMNETD